MPGFKDSLRGLLLALGIAALAGPVWADSLEKLTIFVPATAGGGWDQTGQLIRSVLKSSRLVEHAEITHAPGVSGVVGLAQFVHGHRGDPTAVLIGGLAMVGATNATRAKISILNVTPIARLTADYQALLVHPSSRFKTAADLLAEFKARPESISWVGGASGDHMHQAVGRIADALGIEPKQVRYVAFADGREARRALTAEQVIIEGYGEVIEDVRSEKLRLLAVTAEKRFPGADVPTFRELGIDLVVTNWRGVFAAPDISAAEKARLVELIGKVVADAHWRAGLQRLGWVDSFLPGDAFARFVESEHLDTAARAAPRNAPPTSTFVRVMGLSAVPQERLFLIGGLGLAGLAASFVFLVWQRRLARRREAVLHTELEEAQEQAKRSDREIEELLGGLEKEIARQFQAWRLSMAEREVALLLLKGLRHKEIAEIRQSSERTVRQQALSIYKKAGLEGRTDLAAFFLEDLLAPRPPGAGDVMHTKLRPVFR